MGILEQWKLARAGVKVAQGELLPFPVDRKVDGISSPWSDASNLVPALIAADVFGGTILPVARLEALQVPAVAKGRAILHSLIASHPLVALNRDGKLSDDKQPSWLYRSDTGINPYVRMCAILDDHLFDWASLLAVKRNADGSIADALHVPFHRWSINDNNVIIVDGKPASDSSVVLIPGPGPGLVTMAADDIRAYSATRKAWTDRARNPFPAMVLKEKADTGVTPEEAKAYVEAVAAARRKPDSAVMFLDWRFDIDAHEAEQTDFFEKSRNAQRLDFANYMNLPASVLDGSLSTASLTYTTQDGKRNEVFDFSIPYWTQSIEQALSMDNVVPRGTRVRFDFTALTADNATPTGPAELD